MIKPWHLLTVWVTVFFLFGQQAFITSSEFWPMFASKNLFSFSPQWTSLFMKPLFNFILFLFHTVPLTDTQHIQVVKTLFAANGAAQLVLFYFIFQILSPQRRWLPVLLTILFSLSPYYLTHFFSIRSDQLALTAFLCFVFLNLKYFKFSSPWNILFILLFPLIGFKHIYFSLIALGLLNFRRTFIFASSGFRYERFYFLLVLIGLFIWTANLAISSFPYYLNTFYQPYSSWNELFLFFRLNWFIVVAAIFGFFYTDFRRFALEKNLSRLVMVEIVLFAILIIHPQKFNFFIASLTPILFLPAGLFIIYLFESNLKFKKYYLILFFILQVGHLLIAQKYFPIYTSGKNQLITLGRISEVLQHHQLSYLDGVGLLPRQKNTGCFISPEDFKTNSYCTDQIARSEPDTVIVNPRLLSVLGSAELIEKSGYQEVGPNFYVKKIFALDFKNENLDWNPPNLLFGAKYIF